ncbi:MAG: glutaredoxin family protein [Tepidiformaceae bacterium]
MVTLYGRDGCHLCEEALGLLQKLAPGMGFEITQVDIELDDALLERYVFAIPVIAIDEWEVARAPIREDALEEALREALES